MAKYKTIVLSGGPCSGKSSAKKYIREALAEAGYETIFVSEAATRIIDQFGVYPPKLTKPEYFAFQDLILASHLAELAMALEYASKIHNGRNAVIICDRGVMCGDSYAERDDFTKILGKYNLNRMSAREGTYDGVIHLRTVAHGAENLYLELCKNNPSRYEATPEDAKNADDRGLAAWLGHPHLWVIDNSTDFEGKMRRTAEKIRHLLGIPQPMETERKFLVRQKPDLEEFPALKVSIFISQSYLAGEERWRVRVRSQEKEGAMYFKTRKIRQSDMSAVEIEEEIDYKEYLALVRQKDSNLETIEKIRHHFVYDNQHFELDEFLSPTRLKGLWILEIELTGESEEVRVPEWLGPVEEVTGDKRYKNRNLAKRVV